MCELLGFVLSANWATQAQDISYIPHIPRMTKLCTQNVHMEYMLSKIYTQGPTQQGQIIDRYYRSGITRIKGRVGTKNAPLSTKYCAIPSIYETML